MLSSTACPDSSGKSHTTGKTFLHTLFFFLLVAQISFGQWRQIDFRNHQSESPKIMLPIEQSAQQLHFSEQLLNNTLNRSSTDTITESWVKHYAGELIPAKDDACAIAVDKSGNTYITGSSTAPFGSDFYTIKYSADGTILWCVRYDGGGHDIAQDLTIDNSCNVYVTGWSTHAGSYDPDFVTIKYSSSGILEWVARYSGSGNVYDYTTAITTDASGNVYVTGWTEVYPYNTDYITIKYSPSGTEEWIAQYNGPGNSGDKASAIAVDVAGNVYVTGSSYASGSSLDYATIKYSPSGTEEWVARYDWPVNYYDEAKDIALDASGNIYVTGNSWGSGTNFDYATIKYNPLGNEEWVARYNCCNDDDIATAIAVDLTGNVYITGVSSSPSFSSDYATIKYDSSGNELWVSRYVGLIGGNEACDIKVDYLGNAYVTGSSKSSNPSEDYDYATIKYNTSGNEQWIVRYDGPRNLSDFASSVAVDTVGNIYVTGRSMASNIEWDYDYATIKYDPLGNEEWIERYGGPGTNQAGAKDIAVDIQGNVYVTGFTIGAETNGDYATVKYNSSGYEEWAVLYRGPGNYYDEATALTVDIDGNVYVTGGSLMGWYDGDITTIKYNKYNGSEEWVRIYNGPGNAGDAATDIVIDKLGNIYVTGWSSGNIDGLDFITIKYSSSGIQEWIELYDGPGNGIDCANGIAVDTSGNVYVTGVSDSDYTTIKYSPTGTEEWVARYDFAGEYDQATAITIDAEGNICVTGWSRYNAGYSSDYITIKYDQSGNEQWVARYNGSDSTHSGATDITVDVYGNFYVTGVNAGGYATIKYNPIGMEEWVARYDGPLNFDDASAIALDIVGNVYVTGTSFGSNTSTDYVTIKYTQSGVEEWVVRYNGPGLEDIASAIAVDVLGNVFVTGSSGYEYFWSVFTTIKYKQFPNSVDENGILISSEFALNQNYPNPFNPITKIKYSVPQTSQVQVKVFDVLGNEIETLVNEEKSVGTYEITWNAENLPSGVYFYQLRAGSFIETKKMILLK